MGERRRIALPDGGWLQLNTDSVVDIAYDAHTRRVRLSAGEMLVQTAPDSAGRAFWVDTPLGRLQALDTRFAVRLDGSDARLSVQEGAVAVMLALRHESAGVIEAGRQARFDRKGLYGETTLEADSLAWSEGYLVARQWTLGCLCAELARYRPGVLRCDPAVAKLAISGVFSLDQPEQAIAALQRSLPVRAHYRTRWWVTLVPLA
ncbi:FecR domain-containing protein [Pseudomonas sp. HS-18]|uniref:FecR domain-containing protein n=1 Tax=Pseudomonas sp. HS-18 TaxID=2879114 RepID=UPI001CF0B168|nr:FecR domain-containing protein [Pseudomonas sp. HS-18]UCL86041.1 FecR domain-containing protein [Pseudomonas sp. HS-18]